MAYPYITKADLESRVSSTEVRRILDDDSDGSADANPITRVLEDSSAKVAGYLRGIYDLDTIAANPPNEVKRLTLDVAVAYLAQRHPERVRRDWVELMKLVAPSFMGIHSSNSLLCGLEHGFVPSIGRLVSFSRLQKYL